MTLASLTALIVFFINKEAGIDGFDGVLVILLYQVGEFFQHYAADKSKKSISSMLELNVKNVTRISDNKEESIELKDIKVDDILYTQNIIHAYNIKVDEITERTVICDWYIPVLLNKGIYIELWGVKGNEKYNTNKKEKIELYKKHKLFLIEIEYDELKDNTQRLRSSIKSKINILKDEIIDKLKS